ncbi:MAG: DUF4271 domain-containing protein [Bacteroidales bacterium]|nr:DUF4271 domain-containing protein [Bacteroidales bacterium]
MISPFRQVSHEADAPVSASDRELYVSHPPAWQSGVAGVARPHTPANDSGVIAILVAVMVLIGLNMRHVRRIFRSMSQDLLSVRRRANVFDEHTASETRVNVLQLLQLWVYEGLLLMMWLWRPSAGESVGFIAVRVGLMVGLCVGLYLFQFASCATLGYVFTDQVGATLLRRGLLSSQILLGWLLILPALVALFYPGIAIYMLLVAAALYIGCRICYISKGFRIFYHNFPSLLYFILYLCALEIIPVIITCRLAMEICVKS